MIKASGDTIILGVMDGEVVEEVVEEEEAEKVRTESDASTIVEGPREIRKIVIVKVAGESCGFVAKQITEGIVIDEVSAGSASETAGLCVGDLVQEFETFDQFVGFVRNSGDTVEFNVDHLDSYVPGTPLSQTRSRVESIASIATTTMMIDPS